MKNLYTKKLAFFLLAPMVFFTAVLQAQTPSPFPAKVSFTDTSITIDGYKESVKRDTIIESPEQLARAENAGGNDLNLAKPLTSGAVAADSSTNSFAWLKISGPSKGTISTPDKATTTLTRLVKGTYKFELTVTDKNGAKAKDTIMITLNLAPVIDTGGSKVTPPRDSTESDGGSGDVEKTYAWSKISGPSAGTIVTANAATTLLNNLAKGIYKYVLTVTDNKGATSKDTVQVTVKTASVSRDNVSESPAPFPITNDVNELKVYPNPVRDITSLNINTKETGRLYVSVTDMNGRVVKSSELADPAKIKIFKLDMTGLSDGYYIIAVRFGSGQVINSKVLKYGGK